MDLPNGWKKIELAIWLFSGLKLVPIHISFYYSTPLVVHSFHERQKPLFPWSLKADSAVLESIVRREVLDKVGAIRARVSCFFITLEWENHVYAWKILEFRIWHFRILFFRTRFKIVLWKEMKRCSRHLSVWIVSRNPTR